MTGAPETLRRSAPECAGPPSGGAGLAAAVATVALLVPCLAHATDSASPGSFKLIVHPSVAGERIPKAVVAAIFLCQVTTWGDEAPIKVLDRSLTSPLRVTFGDKVLGMTTLEMSQYWRRQMSKGKVPPNVEESDDAVLAFVASTPGAIAYVAADTPTPPTVKIIQID